MDINIKRKVKNSVIFLKKSNREMIYSNLKITSSVIHVYLFLKFLLRECKLRKKNFYFIEMLLIHWD